MQHGGEVTTIASAADVGVTAIRTVARLAPGHHVVVVGAGPGGLTAAYELCKRGVRVTVLEADTVVGGLSRTVEYEGFRFDIGGHRFFTRLPPVQALWEEVLGDQFISVPRLSRIHYNGRYFNYPLKPLNALTGLGPGAAAMVLLSYLRWQLKPHPVEDTFEQWVTNRFGRRLYEIFFKTYTEKVWGVACSEIRAEWAAQRIQNLSLARAILETVPLNNRRPEVKSLIHEFRYPRLGPGQMWERCRDRVVQLGGSVLMRHRMTRLELRDGSVVAVHAGTPEGSRRLLADHVISTAPLRSLVRAFGVDAPAEVHAAGDGLRYRDFVLVALVLSRDKLFPDNWIYVHTPGVRVGRVQNFNNWSAALVPEPGLTCLGLEYFCFEGDELWASSDAELIAQATRELEVLGLASGDDVVNASVVRTKKAYPIYDSAYREHVRTIRSFVDPIPNLHTVGRNGMHKYNNQDHSMLTALMAVWNMEGASHDVWGVNTEFDYHESQYVEITPVAAT